MTFPVVTFHCPVPLSVAKVILVGSASPMFRSQGPIARCLRPVATSQKRSGKARCLPLSNVVWGPSLK